MFTPWKKSKLRQHTKKQRGYFADKGPSSQRYGFSSSHVWMWELGHKDSWALKSWCFWTVVLEKVLQSPMDCKEIKPVSPKENQSSIFIGSTNAETEAPILWPLDEKGWLVRKDPDTGKDWRQEKGRTEDEMVGWHHRLDEHEFEQALGVGDGQGSLMCCSPWGRKDSDMTERLNWTTFGKTSNLPYHSLSLSLSQLFLYHLYTIISVTHKNVNIPKEKNNYYWIFSLITEVCIYSLK